MAGLFEELRRRNVFKVGAAYLVVAWLVLQVAATAFPALHLPDWTVTFVTVLLLIGLPLALLLAWAYEVTPEGVKRTREVPLEASVSKMTGRRLDFLIIGLLGVAVVGLVIHNYLSEPGVLDSIPETASPDGRSTELSAHRRKSVAVLPFANMSTDEKQAYFADGITEEILSTLAAIQELKVAGRTSSFQFREANKDLREIGKVLGVGTLLEGSVRQAGNKVRITTQLIEAETGFELWSETFDRELADIFEIQEEIAQAVATALQVELGIAVSESVARRTTDNLEAYSLYLQALQHNRNQDVAQLRRALALGRRVIQMDPDFLPGYTAFAASAIYLHSWGSPPADVSLEDVALLMREILARDPAFYDAWVMLGSSSLWRFEWKEAEESFEKAVALNPDSPAVADEWAYALLAFLGRPADAANVMRKAIEVDPLGLNTRGTYGQAMAALGRMNEAEDTFRQVLAIDPQYSGTLYRVASTYYLRLGRPADAIEWYEEAINFDPENPWNLCELTEAFYDLGDRKEAVKMLVSLEQMDEDSFVVPVTRYNIARYEGDEATADELMEYLAINVGRMLEGLYYVHALEWLRRLQASEPNRALDVYRRLQPELFRDPPEIGPWNHGTALSLALLNQQTGHDAEARALARSVLSVINDTTEIFGYYSAPAVAWLVLGDEDRAMEALEKAYRDNRARWGWSYLQVDPLYEPLRQRLEFDALLEHIRADMAEQLEEYRALETKGNRSLVLDFGGGREASGGVD